MNYLKNTTSYDTIIKKIMEEYMIRDSVKNEIFGKLNCGIFRFEDFVIKEDTNKNRGIYKIDIRKEEFYFTMTFDSSNTEIFKVECLPGEIFSRSEYKINFSSIQFHIENWLERVKTEMLNPIQQRYMDKTVEAFIDEINIKFDDMDESYFTREEGVALAKRLDELQEIITNRESDETPKELQVEISKMQNEIEFLKATINTLNKKKWFKNALLKFRTWSNDPQNQELIKLGVDSVKAITQLDLPDIK